MIEGVLPVEERRLATATRRAIEAAGGLASCRAETGKSHAHLSRCGSIHHADSLTVRDAARIDRLSAGKPEILAAYASEVGAVIIILPRHDGGAEDLRLSVCTLTVEMGDVARRITEAFCPTSEGKADVTPREAEAALGDVGDLERATARLRHQLEEIAAEPP